MKRLTTILFGPFILALTLSANAQANSYFTNWPAGVSPQEVGKRVAEHFVVSPHQYTPTIHYSEVATWYGALTFATLTHDDALRGELIHKFEPLMPGGGEAARIPVRHHVDDSIFGVVPLEIAIETKDPKFLETGKAWADRQWENPQPDGLSAETRFWIDDMYMLTLLQLEAYRATGDRKYLDRDALEMAAYLDKLQQPNGLFFHAPDVPFYWGRGDGWVAAGMAEMLRDLPQDHPQRKRIMEGYRAMMAALLKYQGKDGMWRQLIDHDEAWPESSSSAMFTFALVTGVKNGWLDAATYGPAARRAWIAVVGYLDQNQDITNVCEGTGKQNSYDYYLARKRRTGDFHGQAPVLWAASALLR
jgi:unsaturated rhamnogalacturonyl hydrolase